MRSKNTVSTLGTLHDLFLSNPSYGLREFVSALYQFKPDVILSEVLTEKPSAGDASIDGGIEQAIVFAYAKERAVPVIATDWFDADLIREMEEENSKVTPALIKTLQTMSAFRETFNTASLLELNSEATQDHTREIYKVFESNGLMASRKRNDRILANIKKELGQFEGKRVLVIYGMDHKFFIDDHLKVLLEVEVVGVSSWFTADSARSYKISESLRSEVIHNLKTSESLLAARLKASEKPNLLTEKLRAKLPRFQVWMASILKM